MESMAKSQVEDLIMSPKEAIIISYKWIYKIKRNSSGNIEYYKARHIARVYSKQKY